MGKLSDSQINRACKLYRKGLTAVQIAERFNVTSDSIYRHLYQRGIKPSAMKRVNGRRGGFFHRFTEAEEARIAAEYVSGTVGYVTLAEKYNCAPLTIRKVLLRRGVGIKKKGKQGRLFTSKMIAKIVADYKKGRSQFSIAAKLKTSQSQISRILRSAGIDTKKAWGERHGMWKGGRVEVGGRVMIKIINPSDPFYCMANTGGYVFEHRLIMAQKLGRPLHRWETVHHIDGDPKNNRIENLQLRMGKHGKHVAYCCADCGSTNLKPMELKDP